MLHACDTQMFQEETGGTYQVLEVHKQPVFGLLQQNYHFFFLPVISLEASEWTNGENIGGGRSEGGAHSQGINALPISISVNHSGVLLKCMSWQDPQDSLIILSGCGTSGRMAFLITVHGLKSDKGQ